MPSDPSAYTPRRTERFRFFVFTCRKAASDFRQPLAEALGQHYETWYIWLKRRPIVTGPQQGGVPREMALFRFLMFMFRFRRDDKVNVYFNSTNTYFPGIMLFLRCFATAGVWCLDMHDDLRYHNTGLKRMREHLIVRLLGACSDVIVNAAPMLAELFPRSQHLGNASHIRPLARDAKADSRVLIIASFDERFDVDFLSRLAALRPEFSSTCMAGPGRTIPSPRKRSGSCAESAPTSFIMAPIPPRTCLQFSGPTGSAWHPT